MTDPAKQLTPRSSTVHDLLKSDFLEVSSNQRPYEWKLKNHERLWNDFEAAVEDSSSTEPIGHFLGPIYLVGPTDSEPDNRLQIIDGQQRITTLSCMASVLLEFIDGHSEKNTAQSMKKQLSNWLYDDVSLERVPRLELHRIQEFYQAVVIDTNLEAQRQKIFEDHVKPSTKPLKDALNFYYEKFKDYLDTASSQDEKDEQLRALYLTLTNHFYVLSVTAANNAVIYKLFETLNERGLDLSQADLIKNALYENAAKESAATLESTKKTWDEFLNTVDSQRSTGKRELTAPQLIQYSLCSRRQQVKAKDLFVTYQDNLASGAKANTLARELLTDIENWCELVAKPGTWSANSGKAVDSILGVLWKQNVTPLLLCLHEHLGKPQPSKKGSVSKKRGEDFEEAIKYVESFLFRVKITDTSPEVIEKVAGDAARDFRKTKSIARLKAVLEDAISDAHYIKEFKSASFTPAAYAFYVLEKIETYIAGKAGLAPFNHSPHQHIEHILPKKPKPADWGHIKVNDEFPLHLNKLGNLCILEANINKKIKNKSFQFKNTNKDSKGYQNSALALPKDIKRHLVSGDWTYESIANRQLDLVATYAKKVWPF